MIKVALAYSMMIELRNVGSFKFISSCSKPKALGEVTLLQAIRDSLSRSGKAAAGESSKSEAFGRREYFVIYRHQNASSSAQGGYA